MRDFYIILAKIGWAWALLLGIVWLTVSLVRRNRERHSRQRGFEVQPTERHET